MWIRKTVCAEWDMAWFCDRCEKMMYWRTKAWYNPLLPRKYLCFACKEYYVEKGVE